MKSKELKDKSVTELAELETSIRGELFQTRLQNFTNQLDNTSTIPKRRRDLARVATELRSRELDALTKSIEAAMAGEAK